MLVSHQIDNLLGGISQQAVGSRFPNQSADQINTSIYPVEGLKKRPPSEHVAGLAACPTSNVAFHTIDRDADERYFVAASSGQLKVYGADGTAKTVNARTDFSYLTTTDARKNLRFVSVDDYTFVLNRAIKPAMNTGLKSNVDPDWAVLTVLQGNYTQDYWVTISDGIQSRTITVKTGNGITPPNSGLEAVDTNGIASDILAGFANNTPPASSLPGGTLTLIASSNWNAADWVLQRVGNFVLVRKATGGSFWCVVEDSSAGSLLSVVKDKVQTFTELPSVCYHGYSIEVEGDEGKPSYFAEFEAKGGAGMAEGVWKESRGEDIYYRIDEDTMPHLLVRLSDGTFLFTPADGHIALSNLQIPQWGDRLVGTDETNPLPAFIGSTPGDITFFQNRLVITAGEEVCISESGEPFNFWRTTVLDLPDSDRIEVRASHNKVHVLEWAVPIQERLVLMSDRTQFVLAGGDAGLTPASVNITVATDFKIDTLARPQVRGSSVLMPIFDGAHGGVRELVDNSSYREARFDAVPISSPVPSLIKGQPFQLSVDEQNGYVAVLGDSAPYADNVYIYNWMENGGDRVQSAWHRWQVTSSTGVLHAEFLGNYLYLLINRSGTVYLEKINVRPDQEDPSVTWRVLLDRRVDETQCSRVYNAGNDETTITLPYNLFTGLYYLGVGVVLSDNLGNFGTPLNVVSASGNQVVVSGDHTASFFYVGEVYEMSYVFSPIYIQQDFGRGPRPITSGRVSLRYLTLLLEDTGYLEVIVNNTYGGSYTHILNYGASLKDEEARLSLMGKNTETFISLRSRSHYPCTVTGATVESHYKDHSRPFR